MKILLFIFTFLCYISVGTLAYGACYPNRGDFDGSPDSVRVLKHNWNTLHGIGLTRELKAQHGNPEACERISRQLRRARAAGVEQIGKNQRCLRFSDYGIGSYDSTKSSYCKHQSYVLVLHEESPAVWRVYGNGGYEGAKSGLIAEFNKAGKPVPIGAESKSPERATVSPTTIPKDTDMLQKGVQELIRKGFGQ